MSGRGLRAALLAWGWTPERTDELRAALEPAREVACVMNPDEVRDGRARAVVERRHIAGDRVVGVHPRVVRVEHTTGGGEVCWFTFPREHNDSQGWVAANREGYHDPATIAALEGPPPGGAPDAG